MALTAELAAVAARTKGFMPLDEGDALHEAGLAAAKTGLGPMIEIGSYCGKSAIYLGAAAREAGTVLFAVDHHRGSEENQSGWDHHDTEVVDPMTGKMDTLPFFRRAILEADLEGTVVALVGDSPTIAKWWGSPLSFLFIDGGHGSEPAWADYRGWTPHVAPGGTLAIHDVFPNPEDGGRPPYELYCHAIENDGFVEISATGSLRVLRRS